MDSTPTNYLYTVIDIKIDKKILGDSILRLGRHICMVKIQLISGFMIIKQSRTDTLDLCKHLCHKTPQIKGSFHPIRIKYLCREETPSGPIVCQQHQPSDIREIIP